MQPDLKIPKRAGTRITEYILHKLKLKMRTCASLVAVTQLQIN